jgi:hypothetical protein
LSAALLAAALLLTGASTKSYAETGSVSIRVVNAGFIVGVGGGSGTLQFRGRSYALSIGGIGLGTIGVSEARMSGRALHLRNPGDIAGTYAAVGAGVAIIGGPKVARPQNANGVVLELHGVQLGFQVSLNLSGMTIALR